MPETATGPTAATATPTLADYARQALVAANGGTTDLNHHDPAQSEAFKAALAVLLNQADTDPALADLLDPDGDMREQLAALRSNILIDRIERALLNATLGH